MRASSTLALAIVAGLLAIVVGWLAAERGFGPFAQPAPPLPQIVSGAPPTLPKIVTGAPSASTTSSSAAISPNEITVIDGDTIRARGRTVRLVGFDAPESGSLARCDRERQIADRAAAHMRSLVAGGGLELRLVRCPAGRAPKGHPFATTGEPVASCARTGATLPASLSLARSYICGATACPLRGSRC